MKKQSKKVLVVLFAVFLLIGIVGISAFAAQAQSVGANYFIEPVAQQSSVPPGFIGIYTAQDLDNIRNNLGARYILMNDIDLSSYGPWEPIGEWDALTIDPGGTVVGGTFFFGILDGNGYAVKGLKIHSTVGKDSGLFGATTNAQIRNLAIVDAEIYAATIGASVGGFAGFANRTAIENVFFRGTIECNGASACVGGIVGSTGNLANGTSYTDFFQDYTSLYGCGVEGRIIANGANFVGGLIGSVCWTLPGSIVKCFNAAEVITVSEGGDVGGIVGSLQGLHDSAAASSMKDTYNTGTVVANRTGASSIVMAAGGLLGKVFVADESQNGSYVFNIENCYNAGYVTASANTEGDARFGALIGECFVYDTSCDRMLLSNTFFLNTSAANAIGFDVQGGLLSRAKALTDGQMRQQSNFTGYNFSGIWVMPSAGGYPNFTDKAVSLPPQYMVTVTNGSGGGSFTPGAAVTITANEALDGKVFDTWVGTGVTLASPTSASTSFVMPAGAVSVTATYKDPPHTHSWGNWNKDATGHWKDCGCGEKDSFAAHTPGDWIIDVAATATIDGSKHRACSVCGFTTATETIPPTGGTTPPPGIFGTNPRWTGVWWHYILFFIGFGFIWMW